MSDSQSKNLPSIQKKDGFEHEKFLVIPTDLINSYVTHPLVQPLYITDIGYFPDAKFHYRERKGGSEEYILIHCIQGKGIVQTPGEKVEITKFTNVFIPPNIPHVYYASNEDPWHILWIHFKGTNARHYFQENALTVLSTNKDIYETIQQLYISIFESLNNLTIKNIIHASQLFSLLMSTFFFKNNGRDEESDKQYYYLSKAIQYMSDHLDEHLTLDDIAGSVKLSKSYLNVIFKENTSHSPIDFFIHLKMHHACKQLKMADMKIYEVCSLLGYEDPYYFSRIFKKVIGISPSKFKKSPEFNSKTSFNWLEKEKDKF
jgi:AraC family transcriptional regulator, arabinose operon regulatory protein